MKRVYESPVMMLEGFEANEYVAACYEVICNGFKEPNFRNYTHNVHSGVLAHTQNKETYTIYNNGNQPKTVDSYTINDVIHYSVTYNQIDSPEHPNASI